MLNRCIFSLLQTKGTDSELCQVVIGKSSVDRRQVDIFNRGLDGPGGNFIPYLAFGVYGPGFKSQLIRVYLENCLAGL